MQSDFLMHYGIKGMHWGVRRFQEVGSSKRTAIGKKRYAHSKDKEISSPSGLSKVLKKFKYKNFTKLMSPDEVSKTGKGSCHDQVMYEMAELRKMGLKPKATFVMEVDDKGQGGMTHSFVYYKNGDKVSWLENAWNERAGITDYDSLKTIKKEIRNAHKTGEFGNSSKFKNLVFGEFNDKDHQPGESLQDLVDKCLR